jgi:excisionase family DNA binding protein
MSRGEEMPMLLTFTQAARILGVSPRTITRMVNDGMLKPTGLGRGQRKVRTADVMRIVNGDDDQAAA